MTVPFDHVLEAMEVPGTQVEYVTYHLVDPLFPSFHVPYDDEFLLSSVNLYTISVQERFQ